MAMRLLPKSELDKKKADEQRLDVEEGLKLARRIDNLREVIVEEEANRAKYRHEQLERISHEIQEATQRRDTTRKEADDAEDRRKKALEPLDEKRKELERKEEELSAKESELTSQKQRVIEQGNTTDSALRHANSLARDAEIQDSLSNARLQEADRKFAEAKSREESSIEAAHLLDLKVEEANTKLTHREGIVAMRENDATIKEKEIRSREKDLADGWKLLHDREALLERNLKRTQ